MLELGNINDSLLEGDVATHHWVRHELGDTVRLGIGHLKDASDIADGRFAHHFTKGTNVGDATSAVFFGTILNHFVTTSILDVGINIGHGDAVGIEETLKEKAVFEWIKLGDAESVGKDGASSRTTPRPIDDTLRFAPVNEILHD